jgi:hypothetical protein
MLRVRILNTKVDLDLGSLVHVVFGLLAAFLHQELVFTIIFLFKQGVDLAGGEAKPECSGDVAEYACGLIVGLLLRAFLPF